MNIVNSGPWDYREPLEIEAQTPDFYFNESSSMFLLEGKLKFHQGVTSSQHGVWSSYHYLCDLYLPPERSKKSLLIEEIQRHHLIRGWGGVGWNTEEAQRRCGVAK